MPGRKWQVDCYWPCSKLVLEIEGGIWRKGGGAHSRPTNIVRDIEKYNALTLLGWRVLRCTPQQAENGEAIRLLEQAFGRA